MLWSLEARLENEHPLHAHALIEFMFCVDGRGELLFEQGRVELQPGASYCVAADQAHGFSFSTGDSATLRFICLCPEDAAKHLAPAQLSILKRSSYGHYDERPQDAASLRQALSLIPDTLGGLDADDAQLAWSALGLVLSLHARNAREICQPVVTPKHRARIAALQDWIAAHPAERLSLDAAATLTGLSRSSLTREFRLATGWSFVEYCNLRRIEQAAGMLAAKTLGVTEIAFACGFGNLSHFHQQFKARYGLTPAAFRRMLAD